MSKYYLNNYKISFCDLKKSKTINSFFKEIQIEKYVIIFSVLDDAFRYWKNFTQRKRIGLEEELIFRNSYIAIIDAKTSFKFEKQESKYIEYNYKTEGLNILVSSAGYQNIPFKSQIIVNDIDYSKNIRGLNVVLVNKSTKKVDYAFNCDLCLDDSLSINSILKRYVKRLDILIEGMELADKYCSYDNSIFYLILNRHIGDAARVLKDIKKIKYYYGETANKYHFKDDDLEPKEIKKKDFVKFFPKRKCIKKIFIITNQSISGVAKLYSESIDGIIVLAQDELNAIELYAYSGCGIHENILSDQFAGEKLLGRNKFDEGSWVRWIMFGINDTMWGLCLPKCMKAVESRMTISETTSCETREIIETNKIIIDKTVIFCPVAKSSSILDVSIWKKFAVFLNDLGYRVFTNVGPNELPIEGTQGLSVGVDCVVALSKMGCRIIGVQCGLMDILGWTGCGNYTVINVIHNEIDRTYARDVSSLKEINIKDNNVTYLRIEHFEEEYVLKLLEDNFH